MASLRTPTIYEQQGQGLIKILRIASCVTGDTVTFKEPVSSWVVTNRTTTDAISASFSVDTFTIVVANTPDIDLWILG